MSITFCTKTDREGINLSNSNACELLRTLGFEAEADDPWEGAGTLLSAILVSRCLDALSLMRALPDLDPAKETVEHSEPGKATWISCGRSEGYLANRIAQLLELARNAPEVQFY